MWKPATSPSASPLISSAEHDTTINSIVRELLQKTVTREARQRAAADRLLALADQGPYFTTDPGSVPREELHERH
jgi:anti-sigma factor ChrR (cupin superfamily)